MKKFVSIVKYHYLCKIRHNKDIKKYKSKNFKNHHIVMQKKIKLSLIAICFAQLGFAQVSEKEEESNKIANESAFTFTEAQLGDDEDMSANITVINSNHNVYASKVGFLFSPVRFRYRAFNQKYNEVYINGNPMNDMETGQFRYSLVGGLNQQTRNVDFALPFEANNFAISGMGGSNNYDFRPANFAAGHRANFTVTNRNYTLRGMYTYNSGLTNNGWAYSANITYRWADRGYVEGTFYNALSYFLGVQKIFNPQHSLALTTWGNPTERASQGAATDESYWLANNYQYNPYWGYQNGKRRNSRIVNDFAPTALLTWDWKMDEKMKLTTSLGATYSMYKSTKLNYNNSDNPQPDYYKLLPSSYYNVWNHNDPINTSQAWEDWNAAYEYFTASEANRQINWDKLYWANKQANLQGLDAMYFIQAKHNDALKISLASTMTKQMGNNQTWNVGIVAATNNGHHYQTMDDLLGAESFHNVNSYAMGKYPASSDIIQYDLQNPNAVVNKGDIFGYDYNINVNRGLIWTSYFGSSKHFHYMIAGKLGSTTLWRNGNMRNGLAPNNSYGKSQSAWFGDGGGKGALSANLGGGHIVTVGFGYEWRAPQASTAFAAPEVNQDFVKNLKQEHVLSSEIGYQYQTSWLHANLNAYYSYLSNLTEWQNFYFDDVNSFIYHSMTGIVKEYYGIELGLDFKLSSAFRLKAIGSIADAKYKNNANARYMLSTEGIYHEDLVMNKDMREASTPLSACGIILSYSQGGWFIDLNANYYDRIYLSYSPSARYKSTLEITGNIHNDGSYNVPKQAQGKGGLMVDGSVGKYIRMKKGALSINLMVTNLLNNIKICTGGYEQSRSDYTTNDDGTLKKERVYKFPMNPKKYYAIGTNGMLNISYKF